MIARPGRCVVMGILNVTPDSFSDGGRHDSVEAAVAHGLHMAAAGADYIDVGGESTRPGAARVAPEEECRRILPVIAALAGHAIAVSVDTTRASVAAAALGAGALMVNDVSGGLADPDMAAVVAAADVPWVLMHRRGLSSDMYAQARYDDDVVSDVRRELSQRVDAALAAGVSAERIVVDPGFGFAKRPQHDLALLGGLDRITDLGYPVLVGASRKSFLGALLATAGGVPRPADQRGSATLATSVLAARAGAWGVRVHDVPGTADAMRVISAVDRNLPGPRARCDETVPNPADSWTQDPRGAETGLPAPVGPRARDVHEAYAEVWRSAERARARPQQFSAGPDSDRSARARHQAVPPGPVS